MSLSKKSSQVRTSESNNCPFGLPITKACKCAGESIHRMKDILSEKDKKKEKLARFNRKIFIRHNNDSKCPYADQMYEGEKEAVVCTWGEESTGIPSADIGSSPLYPSIFQGFGGLFSYPMSNVTNYYDGTYRNLPFGWFSLQGSLTELIEKTSDHNAKKKIR